jgi:hypothetical protein
MSRLYYTGPGGVPRDIESKTGDWRDYRSFWCCYQKGYTPPPFKLEHTDGVVRVSFELSPFSETCQCQITCTTQALVFGDDDEELGSFCPGDTNFQATMNGQEFSEDEPTELVFNFIDSQGNTSTITVYSLVTVIPQTPLGRVIRDTDGDREILRHEIAVPLYSQAFFDLREIAVQYQVEQFIGSPNNRRVIVDWTNTGLWGTRERIHQVRGIQAGVYGYRVRFRSTFDHASPWSEWRQLDDTVPPIPAPDISYPDSPFAWILGEAITAAFPVNIGGEIDTYSVVAGTLPTGVTLDEETGELGGTPDDFGTTPVTIRAEGPGGTSDAQVEFEVTPPAPDEIFGGLLFDFWDFEAPDTVFEEDLSQTTPSSQWSPAGSWVGSVNGKIIKAQTSGTKAVFDPDAGIRFASQVAGDYDRLDLLSSQGMSLNRRGFAFGLTFTSLSSAMSSVVDFGDAALSKFSIMAGFNSSANRPFIQVFDGTSFINTGLYYTGLNNVVVGWVDSDGYITLNCNGASWTSPTPLADGVTMDRFCLGSLLGGLPESTVVQQLVVVDGEPTEEQMTQLYTYLRYRRGEVGDGETLVIYMGDSVTAGNGSERGKPWWEYITAFPEAEKRCYGVPGAGIWAGIGPPVSASAINTIAAAYSRVIVVVYLGINDRLGFGRSSTQILTDLGNFYNALNSSIEVVGVTIQNMPPANPADDTEILLVNAGIEAHTTLVDYVDGRAALPDSTDVVKFQTDKVHPRYPGHEDLGDEGNTTLGGL